MPTLQDVTLAHSRRITRLQQRRDDELRAALTLRDAELRAIPAAAALYERLDEAAAAADKIRLQTERKAGAARDTALFESSEARGERLALAQVRRRASDADAFEEKLAADAAAEQKYREALAGLGATTPLAAREKAIQDAERVRARDLAKARETYTAALARAQATYRNAVDAALIEERTDARGAEQAYAATMRVADASHRAALSAAERDLARGLRGLDAARDAMERYQHTVSRIKANAAHEEDELFRRFREELASVS